MKRILYSLELYEDVLHVLEDGTLKFESNFSGEFNFSQDIAAELAKAITYALKERRK